jgi:hypothetical protein
LDLLIGVVHHLAEPSVNIELVNPPLQFLGLLDVLEAVINDHVVALETGQDDIDVAALKTVAEVRYHALGYVLVQLVLAEDCVLDGVFYYHEHYRPDDEGI